jgi:hypothetical protein
MGVRRMTTFALGFAAGVTATVWAALWWSARHPPVTDAEADQLHVAINPAPPAAIWRMPMGEA